MDKPNSGYQACNRCGACCVYFKIETEDTGNLPLVAVKAPMKTFKPAGEACDHLYYDAETQKTSCDIHSEYRTKDCNVFRCNTGGNLEGREHIRKDLENIAGKIRGLNESGKVKDLLTF